MAAHTQCTHGATRWKIAMKSVKTEEKIKIMKPGEKQAADNGAWTTESNCEDKAGKSM